MKILHYSDKNAEDFMKLYQESDVLVVTGDLALTDFAGLEESQNRKTEIGVYGNHDQGNYLETLGIQNLHNRVIEFGGWKWGGWQGCLRYKPGTAPMYTEEEAKIFADTFPYVDVLLLHVGPRGMLDDSDEVHRGSENIRRYVMEKKPKVVFCGHQHSNGFLEVDGVKVYRTFGARIVDI